MASLNISRLALGLEGLDARDAERLIRLIGDRLAASAGALDAPMVVETLRVRGAFEPGRSLEWLADQIVTEAMRQLERAS